MDLWQEASRDVEADNLALRMAQAKVAVAGLWPFLALAQSETEFEHRLALAGDHIANAVPVDLLHPVTASLREDFRAVAAKDAEGEDDADDADGDGKPDWLQEKIDKSSAFWHAGRREWVHVAVGVGAFDPDYEPDAETKRTDDQSEDADEDASWKDLGERGPSHEGRKVAYWHAAAQRWVTAAVDEPEGGGNPWYFTGGPEAGPATGMTNQFAQAPVIDPQDPINAQYPAQPQPWTVAPGTEWKEEPMSFNPPTNRSTSSRTAAEVGDRDRCVDCGNPARFVQGDGQRWWSHTGQYGAMADDDHVPNIERGMKVDKGGPRGDSIHHRYTNPVNGARRTAVEGVEGHPGPNPHYFSGGSEGVGGDQQSGFPQDLATEDPDDRVNELYANPVQPEADLGNRVGGNQVSRRVVANTPDNLPPQPGPLQGTEFDSAQERQRWETAQNPDAQQPSRDSTAMTGARRGQFYDPGDPRVQVVAGGGPTANPFGSGNPFDTSADGGAAPNPAFGGGSGFGMGGNIPQTTPPRQMPGGAPQVPSMGDQGASDQAGKGEAVTGVRRHADAENRLRPTTTNPYGTDDPYDAKTWENATRQRPMVGLEHMNFNGPQNPGAREPIRTTESPGAQADDDDDRREASRVAAFALRELVGA